MRGAQGLLFSVLGGREGREGGLRGRDAVQSRNLTPANGTTFQ